MTATHCDESAFPSARFETIKTAPTEGATSHRSLTKSAHNPAKNRKASMATTQNNPALRPDDPRHGKTNGFHAGCREACCRAAIAKYEKLTKYRRHAGIQWAIPALGVQRRIQALMCLGWTSADIAREAGLHNRNGVLRVLHGQNGRPCSWVERKTYRRFAEVYERLCMTIPDHSPHRARCRSLALKKGYLPPLSWDDIDRDPDPAQGDLDAGIDEVKVQRVLSGIAQDCTTEERIQVIERWDGSIAELERLTGWNVRRTLKGKAA